MLYPLIFVLFVIINAVQLEGIKQTFFSGICKRRSDNRKKLNHFPHKRFRRRDFISSNVYDSVVRDIENDAAYRKAENKESLTDGGGMSISNSQNKESSESRAFENDPHLAKFYTFTKMTGEEPKRFGWLELLNSPAIQTFIKAKAYGHFLDKGEKATNASKWDLRLLSNLFGDRPRKEKENELNDVNDVDKMLSPFFNNENKCSEDTKLNKGMSNNVNKISSLGVDTNKSSADLTNMDPYRNIINSLGGSADSVGRRNTVLNNMNNFIKSNCSLSGTDNFSNPEQLSMLNQVKSSEWPDSSIDFNSYDFGSTANMFQSARGRPQESSKNYKNCFDILREVNLDGPSSNKQNLFSNDMTSDQKLLNYSKNISAKIADSNEFNPEDNIIKAVKFNVSQVLPKTQFNAQNIIEPSVLEKMYFLNKILSSNPNSNVPQPKPNFLPNAVPLMTKNDFKSQFFGNNCDIKSLSNLLLPRKIGYPFKTGENKTKIEVIDPKLKINNASLEGNERGSKKFNTVFVANNGSKMQSLDINTSGRSQMTIPEYEKLSNSTEPNILKNLTEVSKIVKTSKENVTDKVVMNLNCNNFTQSHIIPIMDVLDEMWEPRDKNRGVVSSLANNSELDDGYIIIPLSGKNLFDGWNDEESVPNALAVHADANSGSRPKPTNRDLLERFLLNRLFESFKESLRSKRSLKHLRRVDTNTERNVKQCGKKYSSATQKIDSTCVSPKD